MKRFNFFLAAIAALVLTIIASSCTTVAGPQDEYGRETRVYGNRVYVDDPYRGTIVLERDPRTGRYYEVDSYYDGYYGNRIYSKGYRNYGYGSTPTYRRNSGGYYYNDNSNNNQNNDRSSEQYKKNRDEARSKVLGSH